MMVVKRDCVEGKHLDDEWKLRAPELCSPRVIGAWCIRNLISFNYPLWDEVANQCVDELA